MYIRGCEMIGGLIIYGLIIECSSTKTSLRDLRMLFGQRNNKVIEFALGVFGTLVGVNFLLGVLKSWIL